MKNKSIKAIHSWWEKEKDSSDSRIRKVLDDTFDSRMGRLDNIKEFYKKVFAQMIDGLRSKYIHMSTPKFQQCKSTVDNYIESLVKVKENKKDVYVKIGNIELDGTKEQYDEYFSSDEKIHKLINQIIYDAESFFKEPGDDSKFGDLFITD
jgi:hypothetical protein